jgi:hypothetical protein
MGFSARRTYIHAFANPADSVRCTSSALREASARALFFGLGIISNFRIGSIVLEASSR